MKSRSTPTAILLTTLLMLPRASFAALLPQWSVEEEVLKSELIIQGWITEDKQVVIERVFFGTAKPFDKLQVESIVDLPWEVFSDMSDFTRWLVSDPYISAETGEVIKEGRKQRPSAQGHPIVLFLVRDKETGHWFPYGHGSGVKWILGDTVYGYQQPENPGPYALLPDREVKTTVDLYQAIQDGLKKRIASHPPQ